jgi:putative transposase
VHGILIFIKKLTSLCFQSLHQRFIDWTKPDTAASLMVEMLTDLTRSKSELVAENALLRQQLIILSRQVKRPAYRKADRLLLILLARMARNWKQALFIIQPETRLALAPPGMRGCSGSTNPEQQLPNLRSLQRRWR